MTCLNLTTATVTKNRSLESPEMVTKRTHCRNFAGGIVPVDHSFERLTHKNGKLAAEEMEEEELRVVWIVLSYRGST
jgi:hypothetical protein